MTIARWRRLVRPDGRNWFHRVNGLSIGLAGPYANPARHDGFNRLRWWCRPIAPSPPQKKNKKKRKTCPLTTPSLRRDRPNGDGIGSPCKSYANRMQIVCKRALREPADTPVRLVVWFTFCLAEIYRVFDSALVIDWPTSRTWSRIDWCVYQQSAASFVFVDPFFFLIAIVGLVLIAS